MKRLFDLISNNSDNLLVIYVVFGAPVCKTFRIVGQTKQWMNQINNEVYGSTSDGDVSSRQCVEGHSSLEGRVSQGLML